jgi:hypothetical protein
MRPLYLPAALYQPPPGTWTVAHGLREAASRGPVLAGEDPNDAQLGIADVSVPQITPFSWRALGTLLAARNEKIAIGRFWSWLAPNVGGTECAGGMRDAWCRFLGRPLPPPDEWPAPLRPSADFEGGESARVVLLGDPGEGDASQWAMERPLRAVTRRPQGFTTPAPPGRLAFVAIVSDVVYPAGEAAYYVDRFHGPFRWLDVPIYAIPGNHDWDDGTLLSFIVEFCGQEPFAAPSQRNIPPEIADALRARRSRLVWRDAHAEPGSHAALERLWLLHTLRVGRMNRAGYPPHQPAPYWSAEVQGVRLIAIDTGFGSEQLDEPQSNWLRAQLGPPGPKIVLTGKPLFSESELRDTKVHDDESLWELLKHNGNVVAVIGGDVHNYQRYTPTGGPIATPGPQPFPVPTTSRTLSSEAFVPEVVVAGGSGAFTSGTVHGLDEDRVTNLRTCHGLAPVTMYPSPSQSRLYASEGVARLLSDPIAKFGITLVISIGLAGLLAAGALFASWTSFSTRYLLVLVFAPLVAILAYLAIFLPFGTLASALPFPTTGSRSILAGAASLGLLLIALYPVAEATWGVDNWLARLLLGVLPLLVATLAYFRRTFWSLSRFLWWLVLVVVVVSAALVFPWVHVSLAIGLAAVTSGVVGFFAARWVGRRYFARDAWQARLAPWLVSTALALVMLGNGIGVAGKVDPTSTQWSPPRVLLVATLPTAVVGALVLLMLSMLGRRPGPIGCLLANNKDATVWATIEAPRPPFFKSFMEIVVSPMTEREPQTIDLVTYAVSGLERDADNPFVIDHIRINVTGD